MIILFIYRADVENCESIRNFDLERDRVSLFVQFGLKKRICLKKNDEFEFKLDLSKR